MPLFPTMLKSPDLILGLASNGIVARTGANAYSALSIPLTAPNGGTGFSSYAEGDLLYGNVGGTISKLAAPGLPGYVLTGDTTVSWAQLSTLTATTITGTANQVLVNGTSGSAQTGPVTLTLPQDMGTGSSPSFSRLISTVATGTAPFTVASTTVVANLNASQLLGGTWGSPGAIGDVTPSTGSFTVLTASSGIISTAVGSLLTTADGGTASMYSSFQNTGGVYYYGVENSSGSTFGATAYAFIRYIPSGRIYQDFINGSAVFNVTSTGINATAIGTSTASTVACTTLTVNGKAVSEGAADSGGVGFRLLRVPN